MVKPLNLIRKVVMKKFTRVIFLVLIAVLIYACGGGGSGSITTSQPQQATTPFSTTAQALPDLEPIYASFCPNQPNGRSLQHVVPVDLNKDGRMDLVLYLWCSPVVAGTDYSGVTPSRIIVFLQDAQGNFADGTQATFGTSTLIPGGVGEYYATGDFNADGYVDIVWSLQREDGRSINNPPTTQYVKNIALMSQGNGTYTKVEFGKPAWGAGFVTRDNAGGGQDLIAVSNSDSAQDWTYSQRNGWTAVSGYDWVGGSGSLFFSRSSQGLAATQAINTVSTQSQIGVQLYTSVAGTWSSSGGFYYPASVIQKLCCNNLQPSGAAFVSVDGKDYVDPSFAFTCQIRRTPASAPEALTVFEAQEIVGGYKGQVVVYGQTPLQELFKLMSFSPSSGGALVRNSLTIRKEITADVKANRMACTDVNGDGYDDIVLYVSKNNQTPVIYLNDQTGSFDLVSSSSYAVSPDFGSQGLSNYIVADVNNDGIKDLIYFPIVGTAGSTMRLQLYKGLRALNSTDILK